MKKLIDKKSWLIERSKSIISFGTTGGDGWDEWDRYILLEGRKAFHIGNICGTCTFFFERLDGANGCVERVTPREISKTFQEGISQLDDNLLAKVSKILPNGNYEVSLLETNPSFIELGSKQDYFTNEQIKTWGMDSFWELPHHPRIKYYRGTTEERSHSSMFFEFVVPTFPVGWLDEDTVKKYKSLISNGQKTTALCLSVLDVKEPADYDDDATHTQHWCLSHYVIDGHHKMYAAALLQKPITILSFLATKECIAEMDEITELFNSL